MVLCEKAKCSVTIKLTEVVRESQGKGKIERGSLELIVIPNAKAVHFLQRVTCLPACSVKMYRQTEGCNVTSCFLIKTISDFRG